MKIGIEANHLPGFAARSPQATLSLAHSLGFAGVFFKSILDLSPTLDEGELAAIKQFSTSLGLYLECGIGQINPYNTAENPAVRALGQGDYRAAVERMIRAAHAIGCTNLWAETATSANKSYPPPYNVDRFRTDVTWADQLLATEKFLRLLTPLLHELGLRICVETHEEITSYEVVRLVEAIGPDVIGVTFDPGNVVVLGEDPLAAVRRVAPYTYLTHLKDPLLTLGPRGVYRRINACGLGCIDWAVLLAVLQQHQPDLHLTLEDHKGTVEIPLNDAYWRAAHPDLNEAEVRALFRLAEQAEQRIQAGLIPEPASDDLLPFADVWRERVLASAEYLRSTLRTLDD